MLTKLSIGEFAARLASREPAPGGGSAAALSGLLGASLVSMAITLTRGRPEFSACEALLAAGETELSRLRGHLETLIDRDAAAFSAVVAAYGLPQTGEGERQCRAAAIQAAMAEAAAVPLQTARACLAALQIAREIAGKINPHTSGDLAVGAFACHSGLTGALLNIAVNLPAIDDEAFVQDHRKQIRLLRATGDELVAAVQAVVYGEPAFAVMRG